MHKTKATRVSQSKVEKTCVISSIQTEDFTKVSANWWRMSTHLRREYNDLARKVVMSPFLFRDIGHPEKWLRWAIDAKLLFSEPSQFPIPFLSDVRLLNAVLMENVQTELESYLNDYDSGRPGHNILNVNKDIDHCMRQSLLKAALAHIEEHTWFRIIRSNIKKVALNYENKISVAILLSAWGYCEVIAAACKFSDNHRSTNSLLTVFDPYRYIEPESTAMRYKNGAGEFFARNKFGEALMNYTEAIAEKPYNSILYANRALCLLKMKDYLPALADAWRSRILDPKYEKAHYHYANALKHLGRYDDARQAIQLAFTSCADTTNLKLLLLKVNELAKSRSVPPPPEMAPAKTASKSTAKAAAKAAAKVSKATKAKSENGEEFKAEMLNNYRKECTAGSTFLIDGNGPSALKCYIKAATYVMTLGIEVVPMTFTYALGVAYLETSVEGDLAEAHYHFNQVAKDNKRLASMSFYRLACVEFKLNNFNDCISFLDLSMRMLSNWGPFDYFVWPSTNTLIEESRKDALEKRIESLQMSCSYPPNANATCRYTFCSMRRLTIYFTDADFKGFYRLHCTDKCTVEFHPLCWKALKGQLEERNKLTDKAFLGVACFTPDCIGKVEIIKFYEKSDGSLKTQMKWHNNLETGDALINGKALEAPTAKLTSATHATTAAAKPNSTVIGTPKKKKTSVPVKNADACNLHVDVQHRNIINAATSSDNQPESVLQIGTFTLGKEDGEEADKVKTAKNRKKKKNKKAQPLADFLDPTAANGQMHDADGSEDGSLRAQGDNRSDCDSVADSMASSDASGWATLRSQVRDMTQQVPVNPHQNPLLRDYKPADDVTTCNVNDPYVISLFSFFEDMVGPKFVVAYDELLQFFKDNLETKDHDFIISKGGLRHFLLQDAILTFLNPDQSEVCLSKDVFVVEMSRQTQGQCSGVPPLEALPSMASLEKGINGLSEQEMAIAQPKPLNPHPVVTANEHVPYSLDGRSFVNTDHAWYGDGNGGIVVCDDDFSNDNYYGDEEYCIIDGSSDCCVDQDEGFVCDSVLKTKNFTPADADIPNVKHNGKSAWGSESDRDSDSESDMPELLPPPGGARGIAVATCDVGCMTEEKRDIVLDELLVRYQACLDKTHQRKIRHQAEIKELKDANQALELEAKRSKDALMGKQQAMEQERKRLTAQLKEVQDNLDNSGLIQLRADHNALQQEQAETVNRYAQLSMEHEQMKNNFEQLEIESTQSNQMRASLVERATRAEIKLFDIKCDPMRQNFLKASANAAQTELRLRNEPALPHDGMLQKFLVDVTRYSALLATTLKEFEEKCSTQKSQLVSGVPLDRLPAIPVNMPTPPSLNIPPPMMMAPPFRGAMPHPTQVHRFVGRPPGHLPMPSDFAPPQQQQEAASSGPVPPPPVVTMVPVVPVAPAQKQNVAAALPPRPAPVPSNHLFDIDCLDAPHSSSSASAAVGKSASFERVTKLVAVQFPEKSREDIQNALQDFKMSRGNSLSGLSTQERVKGTIKLMHMTTEERKVAVAAGASITAAPSVVPKRTRATAPAPWANASAAAPPSSSEFGSSTTNASGDCAICLELMDDESPILMLDCFHSYHRDCIKGWLDTKKTCPQCRKLALPGDEYPRLK